MAHRATTSRARLPGGHPIHPMLIPFPIGLLCAALFTDVAFWVTEDETWVQASAWLIGAGLVSGVVAAVPGLVDYLGLDAVREHRAGRGHAIGNVAVLVLAAANLAGRLADQVGFVLPWGLALSAVIAGILGLTGWWGGELSYRHRIGVISSE